MARKIKPIHIKKESPVLKNSRLIETKPRKQRPMLVRMLSDAEYSMLVEQGKQDIDIASWQRSRIIKAVLVTLALVILALFIPSMKKIYIGMAIILGPYMYYSGSKAIKSGYEVHLFRRRLAFLKFVRLLTPSLERVAKGASLAAELRSITQHMKSKRDRRLVELLQIEISKNPGSDEPFEKFANSLSRGPDAMIYMHAVADLQRGGTDDTVVKTLAKQANRKLIEQIKLIRQFKIRKFNAFGNIMTMTSFLLVLGMTIALLQIILPSMMSGLK